MLQYRPPVLGPPIQICDALARKVPEAFATILSNCLCHARRNVVDVGIEVVSRISLSWSRLEAWLRQVETLRRAA